MRRGDIALPGDREVWPGEAILHLPLSLHQELPQGGAGQEGGQHGEGNSGEWMISRVRACACAHTFACTLAWCNINFLL